MNKEQEPKYDVNVFGQIFNRATGAAIPNDEPVFVLRGKDMLAVPLLARYLDLLKREGVAADSVEAVEARLKQFFDFATKNPERMKLPDTAAAA